MGWCVYALDCRGKIYIGITNDLSKRLQTHASGKGSRFVRSHLPFTVIGQIECETRSEALKLEAHLKKLRRSEKLSVFGNIR
ncbi:MAG: GIY-YIG nuclease family protein [Nitrospirae bacterium]|nr:GIY-YIG nuclease family protein [Nitrospirota bacterium]